MGQIEEKIMQNYHNSIKEGKLDQARKCIELVRILTDFVEKGEFEDIPVSVKNGSQPVGTYFKPISYRYDFNQGIVVIGNSAINLTHTENKLFQLLSNHETYEDQIKIITRQMIMDHLWYGQNVTANAVRITIMRLRKKIEPDYKDPRIIVNFNKKGYVFIANNSDK